jgi:hypothetical protein
MTIPRDRWVKSTRSNQTADCVEVRAGHTVGVRDTKDRAGGQLTVPVAGWAALVAELKAQQ